VSELASHPATAATLALGWAVLACLLPFIRPTLRHAVLWSLVLAGVPLLGWLTFLCGPGFGVLFLSLGLLLLVWPPLARRGQSAGSSQRGIL